MLNIHFARRRSEISREGILIFEFWHIIIPKSSLMSISHPVHINVVLCLLGSLHYT